MIHLSNFIDILTIKFVTSMIYFLMNANFFVGLKFKTNNILEVRRDDTGTSSKQYYFNEVPVSSRCTSKIISLNPDTNVFFQLFNDIVPMKIYYFDEVPVSSRCTSKIISLNPDTNVFFQLFNDIVPMKIYYFDEVPVSSRCTSKIISLNPDTNVFFQYFNDTVPL